ncbi:disease resistance protein RPM1-like protein [Cinnamomum micranthum f. kanehirae]|uniref:Disease resistance protein RPM1-like protein n=1 Tax=Cinnamomum micranthum f. kanehirae TaxID=337451 RepID=A0A3S3NV47_9MAGN|nr:disease resistance protein RPM1-like protein [Cinnamomum micranthum f. kanehirae]
MLKVTERFIILNLCNCKKLGTCFLRKHFLRNRPTEPFPNQLDDLSCEIVERCEGLPLAIVLVCSLLRSKSPNLIEWKKVHSNLASESSKDSYKYAMKTLSFSYSCLPHNLKSCLLYLGIFPEGQFIKCMRLIRLWMAEGFIEGNDFKTMEEVADDYLKELLNHSVIQVAERSHYGRVISYKVHPLMREFILWKSKEVNFCVLSANKIVSNTEKCRRLSIDEGMKKDDLRASTLSHVRSFFAFGAAKSSISEVFLKFKFLKVLDLENAPLENFPELLTELFFLRYLSLENTKIKWLPKSLGKLVNLETLNLKGTFVCDLPRTIVKLQNMHNLLVCHYDMKAPPFYSMKAVKLPAGIDCLKSLQKLSYIKANSKRGTISELGKLTQLRRLGVVGVKKKYGRNLCASIANMKNLLSFSVRSAVADELLDLEHLETPPPGLRGLFLGGCLKKLPQWIFELQNLARLTLGWSKFEEDPFPLLSSLPALVELKIIEAYSGGVLSCGEYSKGRRGFPNLKSLCLRGLPQLESIDVTGGALASLVKLEIGCCGALKMLPPGRLETMDWHFH